jgi:hypothetical protein
MLTGHYITKVIPIMCFSPTLDALKNVTSTNTTEFMICIDDLDLSENCS